MSQDEIVWKEHEIHNRTDEQKNQHCDDDDDDKDDSDYIFDFFAPPQEDETFTLEFPGLPRLTLRGQSECTTSTGLGIWKGAEVLCDFLVQNSCRVKDQCVLELGAGVGLCALVAHHLGASHVLVTDGDSTVLKNLRFNIQHNITTSIPGHYNNVSDSDNNHDNHHSSTITPHNHHGTSKISCHQLIWGRQLDDFLQLHGRQDVILATDCVYMTTSLQPLWATVDKLLSENGTFFFCNYCASQAPLEKILQVAQEHGFMWTIHGEDALENVVYQFQRLEETHTTTTTTDRATPTCTNGSNRDLQDVAGETLK